MKSELDKLKEALKRVSPILEGLTIEETAEVLELSPSSIDKALKFVRTNASLLPSIDSTIEPDSFINELNQILRNNTIEGKKASGHTGGKVATWTQEEAERIANLFLASGLTLRKASPILGYSKSTLLEILNSDVVRSNPELSYDIRTLLKTNSRLYRFDGRDSLKESEVLTTTINEIMNKYISICKEKGYLNVKR